MSPELRTLLALGACERLTSAGQSVPYVIASTAHTYGVPAGDLAMLMLAKNVACARARAAVAGMREADAKPGDTSSPSPYAHTVGHSKRGGR
jgi:hypothetical protein